MIQLDKGYEFTLQSTKQANLLNKLGNKLESKETRNLFYNSYSRLVLKKDKNIFLIFLSEQENGYITYICNGEYCVGEFVFYTYKEIQKIYKEWELIGYKDKVIISNWRKLSYKDSIVSEFIDPLIKMKSDKEELQNKLKYKKEELEGIEQTIDTLNYDFIKTQKRY